MATSLDHIVKGTPAPDADDVAQHIHAEESPSISSPPTTSSPYNTPQSDPPPPAYSTTYTHNNQPTYTTTTTHPPTHDPNDRLSSLKTPRPSHLYSDPTSLLPSSPPQIYLNLLILEASLRSQYLTLRARRRQNTFFLTLLTLWILYFGYLQWLRPREDGKVGGSQYWLVNAVQMLCLTTGVLTAILFYAIGQWERGVRWPRRWVNTANRGLRGMNVKIVIIRGSWVEEIASWIAFMTPFSGGLWGGESATAAGSSYHYINLSQEKKRDLAPAGGEVRRRVVEDGKEYAEEDIAPGGDFIHLLLLPKPFSPDFRENWEVYRAEYWEKENERRAELRKRVRQRQREIAREEGGMFWWTGWRGWKRARGVKPSRSDVEKSTHLHSHHGHGHGHTLSASSSLSIKDRKRRPSAVRGRDRSHSRSSSRSLTPLPTDIDERLRPIETASRERRWSNSTTGSTATATTTNSRRGVGGKKPSLSAGSSSNSTVTQGSARGPSPLGGGGGSRPVTPREGSESSLGSVGSGSLSWQDRGAGKRGSILRGGENVSDGDVESVDGAGAGVRRRSGSGNGTA